MLQPKLLDDAAVRSDESAKNRASDHNGNNIKTKLQTLPRDLLNDNEVSSPNSHPRRTQATAVVFEHAISGLRLPGERPTHLNQV